MVGAKYIKSYFLGIPVLELLAFASTPVQRANQGNMLLN